MNFEEIGSADPLDITSSVTPADTEVNTIELSVAEADKVAGGYRAQQHNQNFDMASPEPGTMITGPMPEAELNSDEANQIADGGRNIQHNQSLSDTTEDIDQGQVDSKTESELTVDEADRVSGAYRADQHNQNLFIDGRAESADPS